MALTVPGMAGSEIAHIEIAAAEARAAATDVNKLLDMAGGRGDRRRVILVVRMAPILDAQRVQFDPLVWPL